MVVNLERSNLFIVFISLAFGGLSSFWFVSAGLAVKVIVAATSESRSLTDWERFCCCC